MVFFSYLWDVNFLFFRGNLFLFYLYLKFKRQVLEGHKKYPQYTSPFSLHKSKILLICSCIMYVLWSWFGFVLGIHVKGCLGLALAQTAEIERGGALFNQACIGCHDGGGNIIQPVSATVYPYTTLDKHLSTC